MTTVRSSQPMSPLDISSELTVTPESSSTNTGSLDRVLPMGQRKQPPDMLALLPAASRISAGATLVNVASANNAQISEQCRTRASQIDNGGPPPSTRNAVDGTLSLSVRPVGWTHWKFGPGVRRLGAGTGGHVDLHTCKTTKKVVAIKTLPIKDGDEAGMSRRVLEELGIAMNVRHENIIRTHEVVVEPGQVCYVVMEACVVDLLTLLQRRGPEIPQATLDGYFAQLVRGVHYLHAAGIAHRDLKLDNVCVTEQGVVKIVDFGCATLFRRRRRVETPVPTTAPSGCRSRTNRARASPYTVPQPRNSEPVSAGYVETMSTGVCGSDPYMAPELFSGETYYSAPKVDVWALGIMYFALHHMQFPWAVAHADRDPRYRAYVRASSDFLGTWFDGATGPEMASDVNFLNMTQRRARSLAGTPPSSPRETMARVLDPNPALRADIGDIAQSPWITVALPIGLP